jgi:spore maturation protein CgeB
MRIVIYGLSITSSWGNGHATTYRSLAKALAARGHSLHFVERDAEWYRSNRDLPDPSFCTVQIYRDWNESAKALVRAAADADAIVIGSYFPDAIALTRELLDAGHGPILFYDIDTPVTMAQLRLHGRTSYLDASLIPHYAAYLSFTGGPTLKELEERFGSPCAVPFYCSVDPELYKPVACREAFRCDLSYLGTYAEDRQPKLDILLGGAASLLPDRRFLVAGPQYPDSIEWGANVGRVTHVSPVEHPAFYSSSRFTLNLTRDEMVVAGYSPSVRLFEASACGAAILSDSWDGIEQFLKPQQEILLPECEYEVAAILTGTTDEERRRIGSRARDRILGSHTSAHRAREFEQVIERVNSMCSGSMSSAKLRIESDGLSAISRS